MRFFILFFILLISSCSIPYTRSSAGYARPVSLNAFSYRHHSFALNSSLLDTSRIYCFAYSPDAPEYFDCLRFFANGKCLSYHFRGKIDTAAFADPAAGTTGYYHLEKNVLRIQSFSVYAEHFSKNGGGQTIQQYGRIQHDTLLLDHEHIGKRYFACRNLLENGYKFSYVPTSIPAPPFVPNW